MSRRRQSPRPVHQAPVSCEPLEARRMLAVFDGTEGSDTIRITRVGSFTHVNINGEDRSTTDANINISAMGGNDFILMDYVHPNIVIFCGAGNDRVSYGGPTHDLFGELAPALLVGDSGTDTVVFDDSNGPADVPREYLFDDLKAMNQSLLEFEGLELQIRTQGPSSSGSEIQFAGGFPVSQSIIVGGGVPSLSHHFEFGTPTDPIDLDSYSLLVSFQSSTWNSEIFDQDSDSSAGEFSVFTSNGGHRQHLRKGGFEIAFTDSVEGNLNVRGGTTADRFGIGEIGPLAHVEFDGGAGDDTVFTNNASGHDNDLDGAVVFDAANLARGSMTFRGGSGNDFIDLDDSADQAGDGDASYALRSFGNFGLYSLAKGQTAGFDLGYFFDEQTERVNFIGDADANSIGFQTGVAQVVTINGGGGGDTFALSAGVALQDCRGITTLIGGSGTDSFLVSDTDPAFQSLRQYTFNAGSFAYADAAGPRGTITYDSTLESFTVTQNAAGTTTFFNGKLASTQLVISAGDGDDTVNLGAGDLDSNGFFTGGFLLSGAAGNDSIVFDDHLDVAGGGETETYTFGNLSLAKGAQTLLYSTFENQVLQAADVGPTFNLFSISGFLDSTTINGGPTPGSVVHVGQTNLTNISGVVNLNNLQIVRIHDETGAGATNGYTITGTSVRKVSGNPTINYSSVSSIELNCPASADTINVDGLAANTQLTVNANDGNDNWTVGSGNVSAQVLGSVSIFGGIGTDSATINNSLDSSLATQTLGHNFIFSEFIDGQTHSFNSIASLVVNEGPGGTNLAVNQTSVVTTVNGGSGSDRLVVGNGNYTPNIFADLTFNGGTGEDFIVFDDSASTGNDGYSFDGGNQFLKAAPAARTITNSVEHKTLEAGSGNNAIGVPAGSMDIHINANAGNDTVTVGDCALPVTVNTGTEDSATAPFGDSLTVNWDFGGGDAPVTVVVDEDDTVRLLGVRQGGTLRIAAGAVLKALPNGFSHAGTVDLAGGSLICGSSQSQVRTWLTRGYNNGAWNGTSTIGAINSSLAAASTLPDAVGYGLGSDIAISSLGSFNIGAADMVLRYTFYGDADLNLAVNSDDFNILAATFGQTNRIWTQGDSTYDNLANSDDFNALAANFGQSVASGIFSRTPIGGARAITQQDLLEELS